MRWSQLDRGSARWRQQLWSSLPVLVRAMANGDYAPHPRPWRTLHARLPNAYCSSPCTLAGIGSQEGGGIESERMRRSLDLDWPSACAREVATAGNQAKGNGATAIRMVSWAELCP